MDTANNNILSIGLLLLFWVWEDSTVKLIVGGFTVIWISRQLYVSFKKERRATEKRQEEREEHQLKMAVLRKQLGKEDKDKPSSEA